MAELTAKQAVFLRGYVNERVGSGDPKSQELLDIVNQVNKVQLLEDTREDVQVIIDEINDNLEEGQEPFALSEEEMDYVMHRVRNFDYSDYYDYIRSLLSEYKN